MAIQYNYGDVDNHGHTLVGQAGALGAEHQAILRDVEASAEIWGGVGSNAYNQFVTELGRNFQTIYDALNEHGMKVRAAGNNMADTDSSVAGSWSV